MFFCEKVNSMYRLTAIDFPKYTPKTCWWGVMWISFMSKCVCHDTLGVDYTSAEYSIWHWSAVLNYAGKTLPSRWFTVCATGVYIYIYIYIYVIYIYIYIYTVFICLSLAYVYMYKQSERQRVSPQVNPKYGSHSLKPISSTGVTFSLFKVFALIHIHEFVYTYK